VKSNTTIDPSHMSPTSDADSVVTSDQVQIERWLTANGRYGTYCWRTSVTLPPDTVTLAKIWRPAFAVHNALPVVATGVTPESPKYFVVAVVGSWRSAVLVLTTR
jgi:hypothetical protein